MAYRTVTKITGIDELKKGLSELEKDQYPFAMRNAINELSETILPIERTAMLRQFDRPTTFTLNSLRVEYATKTKLIGGVKFKDPARLSESQHYLYPNTYGVKRGFKKFEAALYALGIMQSGWNAVPGKSVQLDSSGNVPQSIHNEILSWFSGKTTDAAKDRKRRGTKKTSGYEYFARLERKGSMLPGIYKRTFRPGFPKIESMFIFVRKSEVDYTDKYKFHEIAKSAERQYFKQIFEDEMQKALETAFPPK